ncbi:MAG: hypothetical protein ABJA86_01470 [Nocardioidaceae bacterium]
MAGLLGIGVALTLGVFMRLATACTLRVATSGWAAGGSASRWFSASPS